MRILQVVSRYQGEQALDGMPAAAALLVRSLRAAGADVTVFGIIADAAAQPGERWAEPWEHYFPAWHGSRLLISPAFTHECFRRLPEFDVVHIHGLWRYPSTLAAWLCRRRGVPYVFSPHGMLDQWATRFRRYRKLLFWYATERLTVGGAARLHFTTDAERTQARAWIRQDRGTVVPLGVDLAAFRSMPPRDVFRTRYRVDPDAPLIAFLGRLHPVKGVDVLIQAMCTVVRQHPAAVLALAGPDMDGYERQLKTLASQLRVDSSIRWVGPLCGTGKLELFTDSDLFALPSFSESFGLAAVEAMASGVPVVLGEGVAISGKVEARHAGWRVRTDPDELATVICGALRNADERRARADAGRRLVATDFGSGALVAGLMGLYEECVSLPETRHRRSIRRRAGGAN